MVANPSIYFFAYRVCGIDKTRATQQKIWTFNRLMMPCCYVLPRFCFRMKVYFCHFPLIEILTESIA